jgi:hypothetical protein
MVICRSYMYDFFGVYKDMKKMTMIKGDRRWQYGRW